MARGEHPPSCAAGWRTHAEREGWPCWRTVQEIHRCCGVRLLKAHRLTRGWRVAEAGAEFRTLARNHPELEPINLTEDQLNHWENSDDRPRARTIDRLCLLYRSRPDRLGLANDYSEAEYDHTGEGGTSPETDGRVWGRCDPLIGHRPGVDEPSVTGAKDSAQALGPEEDDVERRQLLRGLLAAGAGLSPQIMEALGGVRRRMDATLNSTSVTAEALDHWELTADRYGQGYQGAAPLHVLGNAVLDFAELRQLVARRQPVDHRRRLCHVVAQLAGVTAIILHDLGDHGDAHAWFRTARSAADETGDRNLRGWVLAREAMVPLNFGSPTTALALATQARAIAGSTPTSAAALAAAVESRAHALLGHSNQATAALRHTEATLSKLDTTGRADTWYGYPEQKHYVHASQALTLVGAVPAALAAQQQALRLSRKTSKMSTTLVHLDHATCLVKSGDPQTGFHLAGQALLDVTEEYRTPLIMTRARDLLTTVPPKARTQPAVRDYLDVLDLGA